MDFSRQADVQILFPYNVAAAHSAPAIVGEFDRLSALAKILEGSRAYAYFKATAGRSCGLGAHGCAWI